MKLIWTILGATLIYLLGYVFQSSFLHLDRHEYYWIAVLVFIVRNDLTPKTK